MIKDKDFPLVINSNIDTNNGSNNDTNSHWNIVTNNASTKNTNNVTNTAVGRPAGGGQHESRAGDEPSGDPDQATAGLISGSVEEQRRC